MGRTFDMRPREHRVARDNDYLGEDADQRKGELRTNEERRRGRDEANVGRICSASCSPVSQNCPIDLPAGVTAKPSCEIRDPVGHGYHCALTCMQNSECGSTNASQCDSTFSPGICMYVH